MDITKILAFCIVACIMAGGVDAYCAANEMAEATPTYYSLEISNVKDLHEGDEVLINYTYHDNRAKTVECVRKAALHITGYRDGEVVYSAVKNTGEHGEPIRFMPVAGEYLVQTEDSYSRFIVYDMLETEEEISALNEGAAPVDPVEGRIKSEPGDEESEDPVDEPGDEPEDGVDTVPGLFNLFIRMFFF